MFSFNKKFVGPVSSVRKIGKFVVTFFVTTKVHLFSEELV
ncbi:hypothetical protein BN424_339 [Carnobacterium maltaromaticum LMA28]|uniref:Uncharacterized protein n=1 Tax=Carnobacterium maltaromaticum LMA28 TaxID=1234679 RepID=K8E1U9_CARML|nr:hypothetical protein BN424_339 [Carnobacterium maltaromaticum LMA28]